MSHNITIEGGKTVKLLTAGKYCDQDIIVTAGGSNSENSLYYATKLDGVYSAANFPENYSLTIRTKNVPTLYQAFGAAVNLKHLKLIIEDKETPIQFSQTFRSCGAETVDLSETSCKLTSSCAYCFFQATTKNIIGALDLSACTDLNYAFFSPIEEVRIVPGSIYIDVRFNSGGLTPESIESIIEGLADLTGQTTRTLTLNGVWNKLTEDQLQRITNKNWSLAY